MDDFYLYTSILAFSRTYQKLQLFAINACANNFWNVSNAHAKRMFLVTWVHSFTHVLHLSYHAFSCDREVGKVWCNWNKLNATLYTAHGVSKGELIFMFWWFWYRFFKNFSPRRRVHRTFKMKLRNDLMKLIFVFDKSSKIQFQWFIILYD